VPQVVTPAKAEVQKRLKFVDSRLHGNDRKGQYRIFHEFRISVTTIQGHGALQGF